MTTMASQNTSLTVVYSTVYSDTDQIKHRVTGLCEGNSPGPVNSPHKGPVTWKMFPFDDVIMLYWNRLQVRNFVAVMTSTTLSSLAAPEVVDDRGHHHWQFCQQFENYTFKITSTSPRGQWVDNTETALTRNNLHDNTYRKISNISHQITKPKWFSSRLAAVFVQSIEARC